MILENAQMELLAEEATALLKALAHPARLMICCQLRDQEMSVGEIEAKLGIRQPRLSRELAKLREEKLVETRRESKVIFYRLSPASRAPEMVDAICSVMLGQTMPSEVSPALKQSGAAPGPPRIGGYGVFAQTNPDSQPKRRPC